MSTCSRGNGLNIFVTKSDAVLTRKFLISVTQIVSQYLCVGKASKYTPNRYSFLSQVVLSLLAAFLKRKDNVTLGFKPKNSCSCCHVPY